MLSELDHFSRALLPDCGYGHQIIEAKMRNYCFVRVTGPRSGFLSPFLFGQALLEDAILYRGEERKEIGVCVQLNRALQNRRPGVK